MKFHVFLTLVSAGDCAFWGLFGATRDHRSKPSTGFLSKRLPAPGAPPEFAASLLAADLLDEAEADAGSALQLIQESVQVSAVPVAGFSKPTSPFQKAVNDLVDGFSAQVPGDVSGDVQAGMKQQPDVSDIAPDYALSSDKPSQEVPLTTEIVEPPAAAESPQRVVSKSAKSMASEPTAAKGPSDVELKLRAFPSWEAKLIETVASDDGDEAQSCLAHCRYGEESRHSWPECIERCVHYDLTKRMLFAGLPASEHVAVHLEAEVPAGIDDLKIKKRSARSEEL